LGLKVVVARWLRYRCPREGGWCFWCLTKALGLNIECFAGGEHKQGPSRLKKRPDAWRARCTAPAKRADTRNTQRSGGAANQKAVVIPSLPVPVLSLPLPSRPTRPTPTTRHTTCHPISCTSIYKPPTVHLVGPRQFRFFFISIVELNNQPGAFFPPKNPNAPYSVPKHTSAPTSVNSTRDRHNVYNFYVRRAHVSQRGRGLRGHCLPVLQLRQLLGACRQAEPVVHLLLHCKFLSILPYV
jgi:hypothetical protein